MTIFFSVVFLAMFIPNYILVNFSCLYVNWGQNKDQIQVFPRSGESARWLSGLRRSHVHSLMIARRSLCPEKLGSNPGQGSKGINFSGWHGLDMSITVTKRR